MAQSGYTPIQLYYSTTGSAQPLAADLRYGELALNVADGRLYYKDLSNTVQLLTAAGSGGGTVTSVSGSGGTTGLTLTGGPISSTGTLTLGGTLGFANGGTGNTSYTDGQLLIGNTATGGLTKATLTAGSNVTITNGNGTITIASTGGGGSGSITTVAATYPATVTGATGPTATIGIANGAGACTTTTGTGALVFNTNSTINTPTISSPSITGHPTIEGVTSTGATGSGALVFNSSPTFISPFLGTPQSGNLSNCSGYTYSNLGGTVPTWNQNTTGNAATATTAGNVSGTVAIANGGTGSTTKNFVDLTTTQSIAGDKTFSGVTTLAGQSIAYGLFTGGTTTANSMFFSSGSINFWDTDTGNQYNSIYYTAASTALADQSYNINFKVPGSSSATTPFLLRGDGAAYKPGGGSWSAPSDARLKDKVTPLTGALAKITALNPVSYTWKISRPNDPTVGFIAQEVQAVIPNAVTSQKPTTEEAQFVSDKTMTIGWQNDMTAYLVGAIKELKAEIDALKAAK